MSGIPSENFFVHSVHELVPGDGGTQMEANLTGKPSVVHPFCRRYTSDYFDLWLNMQEFLPIAIDCFAHNIMLDINPETGEVTDMPGVDVRIPGFGHTSSVEFLDKSRIAQTSYFFGMIESLVKMGYRRGMDVTAAPYDFRRAPEQLGDYYDRLKALIERTYQRAGNEKVVIVGHSLGNLVALRFFTEIVDQEWKDTYIKSHVAVAPPWGGSVKIVLLYTSGYNFENSEYILPSMGLRTAQRTFTSSAYLFPNRLAYRDDEVLATVGTKNYTLADMKTFFDEINYSIGWRQVEKLDSLNRKLPAPGVKVYCVYGVGEPTTSRIHWPTASSFPDRVATDISDGEGDGTVDVKSASLCKQWNPENNAGKDVTLHHVLKADHMYMLHHPTVLDVIHRAVSGRSKADET
ncbi:hypothetical protein Q1695_008117 [Nippostrongylus brasiliensis]|nr:hypothetical protein Q1695_008117 [Nippostrongylus brasiliensis]